MIYYKQKPTIGCLIIKIIKLERGWITIYTTNQLYKAEILKEVLADQNIDSVVLNKQDSSYLTFGSIEVLVTADNVISAKFILNKTEL